MSEDAEASWGSGISPSVGNAKDVKRACVDVSRSPVGCRDALDCSTVEWSALLTGAVDALQILADRMLFSWIVIIRTSFDFSEMKEVLHIFARFRDNHASERGGTVRLPRG